MVRGSPPLFLALLLCAHQVLVLQGLTLTEFLAAFGTAVVGIILIAALLQGYLAGIGRLRDGPVGWLTRVPLRKKNAARQNVYNLVRRNVAYGGN